MRTQTLRILGFAVLAAGTASAASAADIYQPLPPIEAPIYTPVSAYNWTGFYAGVNGGWGFGKSTANTGSGFGTNLNGGTLGAQAGYNYMFANSVVAGIEADIAWTGFTGTTTPGPTVTQKLNWLGTVRGRVGYAFNNVMPYITGGFAYGSGNRATSIGPQNDTQTHTGYVLGAGIEWAFAQNWTAKLEYQYVNLGAKTYNFSGPPSPSVKLTDSIVKVGLNYKF